MSSQDYVFQSRWEVPGDLESVRQILTAPLELPLWWPSVYLSARRQDEIIHLRTRGFLPYTLSWSFRPEGLSLQAWGDLEGHGEWTLTQVAPDRVGIVYDWTVRANKPVLRHLSWLLKPLFEVNHAWAMARGEESLRLELRRRKGERQVPAPPGPVRDWPYLAVALLGLAWWWRKRR